MATNGPTTEALRFHWEHGGFSYDPATETADQGRARCALAAAGAEAWAAEQGIELSDEPSE